MKKRLSDIVFSFMLVLSLVLSLGTVVNARDNYSGQSEPAYYSDSNRPVYNVNNIYYELNSSKNTAMIVGNTIKKGKLKIPSSIRVNGKSYKVTAIDDSAFMYCSGVTGDLKIPNSVTKIGIHAFMGCYNMTGTLTIPKSVKKIKEHAFYDCYFKKIYNKSKCKLDLGYATKSSHIFGDISVSDFSYCYVDKAKKPCVRGLYVGNAVKGYSEFKSGYGKGPYVLKVNKKCKNDIYLDKESKTVEISDSDTGNLYVGCQSGRVTYKKISQDKNIAVSKTGEVSVKNLKKGTYKVRVKMTSPKNVAYKSCKKTATFKIVVK